MTTDQVPSRSNRLVSTWLLPAAAATTTALSKQFVPFYHLHSTVIFVGAAFVSSILIVPLWKLRPEFFLKARSTAVVTLCLWACATLSYALFARQSVPLTYLIGFFLFSGFFILLGVAAAGSPRTIAVMLAAIALTYLVYIGRYVLHFGFLFPPQSMVDQFNFPYGIGDIFGLSSDPEADRIDLYVTMYQNVGRFLALGALAALMLVGDGVRRRVLAYTLVAAALALVLWVGARGSLLELVISISISFGRRPVRPLILLVAAMLIVTVALFVAVEVGIHANISVIDRTIDEIQYPNLRTRGSIQGYLFMKLRDEPYPMILGRGLGMFPVEYSRLTPDGFSPGRSRAIRTI